MKLNPPLKAMHPFGATVAEECVAIFMYDVRALALETQAHVPSYAPLWLEKADMNPAYDVHRLTLQTLQSREPTERWILKTPNHLWHLDAMLGLSRRQGHLDSQGSRAGRSRHWPVSPTPASGS